MGILMSKQNSDLEFELTIPKSAFLICLKQNVNLLIFSCLMPF